MQEERGYISEISAKRKKAVIYVLLLYGLGYVMLWSVGGAINENAYLGRGYIASFIFVVVLLLLPYVLYRKK